MTRTRQLRLNDPDLIRKRIGEFRGKKINIVLKDNRVMVGEVENFNEAGLTLKNMRLKKTQILFSAINELYFDTIS